MKIVDEAGKEISLREAATISSEYKDKYEWTGNKVKFSNLRPRQTAKLRLLGMEFSNSTTDIVIYFQTSTYADMKVVEASFDPEDFEITDYYWKLDNKDEIHQKIINLPYGSKTPSFYIVGDNYSNSSSNINMQFPNPEFTECDAVATSLTKARLTAKCNLSTGATDSIEWRRDDAPDNVKSKVENCPVVNGTLMGELRGLKDDVYYKFRPFYERDGQKFYGEWVGFYTGDANVYFEPEVGTLPAYITDNNAELEGYAFPGTDDVSESGIEYRNTGKATRADAEWTRVAASSSTFFKVRLDNLEYNSNYEYRAFAVAGDKTYYGNTAQFSIGNDPSGIESVITDSDSRMKVSLYRNPVVGNPKVIVNAEEENVDCYIHSITGMLMKKCTVAADGTPQEVEADLRPGMYIVTVSGKTGINSVRMIVK